MRPRSFRCTIAVLLIFATMGWLAAAGAKTIYVKQDGTGDFSSINEAAQVAEPGDTVLVYGGIYREHVMPARGGTSDQQRITYKAAPGEKVIIKGSEVVAGWTYDGDGVWVRTFCPDFFGSYNPYATFMARGPLRPGNDRLRTLGEVYLNGIPLDEVNRSSDVRGQVNTWAPSKDGMSLFANFGDENPNEHTVEVHVREQVFAPKAPAGWGLGFITVSGFTVMHSANNYDAALSKAQNEPAKGAISTTGGHNWIIENNTIEHAKSIGIDFGLQGGRSREEHGIPARYGHHVIRNNTIRNTGSTGMLGTHSPFTQVVGNSFRNTNRMRTLGEAQAALKFVGHNIDILIKDNYFHHESHKGTHSLFLDWANQGAVVTGNIFAETAMIKLEASHGPTYFVNNVLIKTGMIIRETQATVFAHNLFYDVPAPRVPRGNARNVHVYRPHTLEVSDQLPAPVANNRYLNNIFIKNGVAIANDYPDIVYDNSADFNLLLEGAHRFTGYSSRTEQFEQYDQNSVQSEVGTHFHYESDEDGTIIEFVVRGDWFHVNAPFLAQDYFGAIPPSDQHMHSIAHDFFGRPISEKRPVVGPFADLQEGTVRYTLWPKNTEQHPDRTEQP